MITHERRQIPAEEVVEKEPVVTEREIKRTVRIKKVRQIIIDCK